MKFGVFTVSLPEYTPEESVKLLKEMGYDGVEWRVTTVADDESGGRNRTWLPDQEEKAYEYRYWLDNKSTLDVEKIGEEVDRIMPVCREEDLEVFALSTYLNTDKYDDLVPVFKAAQKHGIPMVRVGLVPLEPAYDKETRSALDLSRKMRTELEALVELSKETGVKTVIEIHSDTLIASPSAAYNMLRGLDPNHIGVIFDPGNMVKEGYEEYRKGFELLGDYVAHVHVKNGRYVEKGEPNPLGAKVFEFVWAPLDQGQANLLRLFEVLNQVGYDGTVSVEDFSDDRPTEEKLKHNLDFMKKAKAYAESLS